MRILSLIVVGATVLGLLVNCGASDSLNERQLQVLSSEEQVVEAFIRKQGCGSRRDSEVCFVGLAEDRDPSEELLTYLSRSGVRFEKNSRSESTKTDPGLGFLRDKVGGQKGVGLFFSKFNWSSESDVSFSSSWFSGALEAGQCEYRMMRLFGDWRILSRTNCSMA